MHDSNMSMPSEKPSMDMIKQALMKVIDDMTLMESDRLMPDERKPKVEGSIALDKPTDDMPMDDSEDPAALDAIMGEADKADSTGAMPEDQTNDLPPEIMDVVRKKKAEQKPV